MIAEAMTKVEELVKALKVPVVQTWGPRDNVMYVDENNILQFKRAEVGPTRSHKVSSLPSFGEYVARWSPSAMVVGTPLPAAKVAQSVWYNRKGVIFFPDDIRREDRATIDLEPSHQMSLLEPLGANGKDFEPRAFWKFIRIDMDKCVDRQDELVRAIGNVKWTKQQQQGTEVGRGKSSLGNEIRSQIEGLDKIPERVTFRIPAFKRHVNVTVTVECAIELNDKDGAFTLIPFPGEIEKAWSEAEYSLLTSLVGMGDGHGGVLPKDFPVFYGSP